MNGAKIYVDGGVGSSYCHVAWVDVIAKEAKFIIYPQGSGHKFTNNEAEYWAVIEALKVHLKQNIMLHSDSQLIVGHLSKGWKVNYEHLDNLRMEVVKLCDHRNVDFRWCKRSKNIAGILLEMIRIGMQGGRPLNLVKAEFAERFDVKFI